MSDWNQSERKNSRSWESNDNFQFWPSDPIPLNQSRLLRKKTSAKKKKYHILRVLTWVVFLGGGVVIGLTLAGSEEVAVSKTDAVPNIEVTQLSSPIVGDVDEPVAAVAEAVAPSVVRIDTPTGTGSGIIYDSAGAVVTNAHVVRGAESVEIQLADGTRATGKVLGSDPNVDIAIVQIQENYTFKQASFASLETVRVGQLAVAIGSPFGLEQSVTAGIVSAINRAVPSANIEDGSRTIVEMIQTDAPINPGNSGGALVDRQGRVVGMNTLIRTDGTVEGNLGVGFAIPTDTIFLVTERIINGESLENGFLGISGQNPTIGRAGALIIDVVEDSPASISGLESGDLIIEIDDSPILGMSELAARIRLSSPGTTIEIKIIRNGEQVSLPVTLGTLGSFD
ncbi:MAG: trypsin-like peptidase domain-containing protein [Acidimicrobiales bacterium]|nr:trypsin-like peptidase domain-containing protein [Acidimicrobiales bacterium]|tara:strand:- start:52707 stop:53897 length:1191 start_codon:yes stop_codon:yes gene_type:complete